MSWEFSDAHLARLGSFLADRDLTGPQVSARTIGDGHSNLTFLVSDGEREVVVRRPPPPPVPRGANDVLREARLIQALTATPVPVPTVLATAEAGELLDVPFYVMSYVKGPVVTETTPESLAAPDVRRGIGESMVDTLVALHAVDWETAGLGDLGRPAGFNARHLERMGRLIADSDGNLPAVFDESTSWLRAHVPAESGAAIVHNDYRIGNVILGPDSPGRVLAVLDWELATLGDPLFDLGYFLANWPVAGEPLTPTARFAIAVLEPGFPTRAELAQRYAAATGADLENLPWYTTLALWKLAVLYEYGRRRAEEGVGDQYYRDPELVRSFLTAAEAVGHGG